MEFYSRGEQKCFKISFSSRDSHVTFFFRCCCALKSFDILRGFFVSRSFVSFEEAIKASLMEIAARELNGI